MAALADADPGLDPDAFFDNWPADLWSALGVSNDRLGGLLSSTR
jgi:hypothetical protein